MKKLILVLLLAVFVAGGTMAAMSAPASAQPYEYPAAPGDPYVNPWVGPGSCWVFYNGDWFCNGVLYYYFGPVYGWSPYWAFPVSFIVYEPYWYGPMWGAWFTAHPNVVNVFINTFPFWRSHHHGEHPDREFFEKHHGGKGSWQGGWKGHPGAKGGAPEHKGGPKGGEHMKGGPKGGGEHKGAAHEEHGKGHQAPGPGHHPGMKGGEHKGGAGGHPQGGHMGGGEHTGGGAPKGGGEHKGGGHGGGSDHQGGGGEHK